MTYKSFAYKKIVFLANEFQGRKLATIQLYLLFLSIFLTIFDYFLLFYTACIVMLDRRTF